MSYYYYPLCTKDFTFENIFSSESISPYIFYQRRDFGIDYFYKIPKVHHEKAIILFKEPLVYETGSPSTSIIKFFLEIDIAALDSNEQMHVDDGIIGYKKTIYLNKNNFNVLFFSDIEKKVVCLRSEMSLPTKGLGKYNENFKLISENDCRKIDLTSIEHLKIGDEGLMKNILYDRLYNAFKGFLYGAFASMVGGKSKQEIAITRSFQEIINAFAELKNRKDTDQRALGSRYSKTFGLTQTQLKEFYDKLINNIAVSQRLFNDLFPPQIVSKTDIASYLFLIKGERLKSLEDALQYLSYRILDDELLGTNNFQHIKTRYLTEKGIKDPSIQFDKLKMLAENYLKGSTTTWNSDKKNTLSITDEFKESIQQLSRSAEQKFIADREIKKVSLQALKLDPTKNKIIVDRGFGELNDHELEEYQMIANIIWGSPKLNKSEIKKDKILNIVEKIGDKTSKVNSGKQTRLYRYLNNEINDYVVENTSSIVMKNFVAFIFNVDSLEALENYVVAKDIEKKWMSNSFWCLFNGFANTSGNFLKNIFNSSSEILQEEIDNYLKNNIQIILPENKIAEETINSEALSSQNETAQPNNTESRDKVEEFYNKYVKGNFTIDLENFAEVFSKKSSDEILKELKNKYKVLKKDGKKLIEQFSELVTSRNLFE